MLIDYRLGQGSIVLRVKILDSSVSTGAGKTGLTFSSSGLVISTIADNEATATAYTAAGSTIETVTTLGTYAAPTATKCRFREVDATNHKGVYEIQIADARFAVTNAKSILVSVSGATNAAETDALIPLRGVDPYDAVRFGQTALPNVASGSAGGILTSGTGTSQLSVSGGVAQADAAKIAGSAAAATNQKNAALAVYSGSVTGATTTTTLIDSGLNSADDSAYTGRVVIFLGDVTAALKYQATAISAFDHLTNKITFTALTRAPASGDSFIIV